MRTTYKEIDDIISKNINLNFGLYFNKFIELDENNNFVKSKNHETSLLNFYEKLDKDNLKNSLIKKNESIGNFIKFLKEVYNYEIYEEKHKLKKKMVLGIGETTAAEIGMTFDYSLGVPYIPASSIKGVVRFAYLQNLVENITSTNDNKLMESLKFIKKDKEKNDEDDKDKYYLEENDEKTNVYLLFGGDKKRRTKHQNDYNDNDYNDWEVENTYKGSVIFFDAYPVNLPKLTIDIINIHYPNYYNNNNEPPRDIMNPILIKFLTVAEGTEFIFRYAINRNKIKEELKKRKNDNINDIYENNYDKIIENFKNVFINAITKNGIGAKTNLDYGIFE